MKKQIHVVGAVIVQDNKILCAQRGADQSLPLMWEFPGGKIQVGETPKEAIKREILEELKCEIEVGDQIENTVYEYDFGIVHLTTYYCELTAGTPLLTEHASIQWLPALQLDSLDWAPADIPAVEKIMKQAKLHRR